MCPGIRSVVAQRLAVTGSLTSLVVLGLFIASGCERGERQTAEAVSESAQQRATFCELPAGRQKARAAGQKAARALESGDASAEADVTKILGKPSIRRILPDGTKRVWWHNQAVAVIVDFSAARGAATRSDVYYEKADLAYEECEQVYNALQSGRRLTLSQIRGQLGAEDHADDIIEENNQICFRWLIPYASLCITSTPDGEVAKWAQLPHSADWPGPAPRR